LRALADAILAPAEDPRQPPPTADEGHVELLRRLCRATHRVAASRQKVAVQIERASQGVEEQRDRARDALRAGREDLARMALRRRRRLDTALERMRGQALELAEEEARLALAEQDVVAAIDALHARREVSSARYAAAEARVRVGEALAGLAPDLTQSSKAVDAVNDRAEEMDARAAALGELITPWASIRRAGPLDAELSPAGGSAFEEAAVALELEALKRDVGQPPNR
jgi:phage shock protein A